ncbi:MAG TPA: hypothetical protein VLS94_07435 [Fusibacter sp.]|jgi:cell division protein FtsL|nr:hypothetical protein [Fusibacter sp.]
MKNIKKVFLLLMVVATVTLSVPAVFAADDDYPFPKIQIQSQQF